jgi:hypothetical protein
MGKESLNKLENSKFFKYLNERIQGNDYRGYHLSQHNRLPFDKVIKILQIMYENIGEDTIRIHVGDWKYQIQEGCERYYKIVNDINSEEKELSVTKNSLKKNIFPDLDRMGFLKRFDKNKSLVSDNKRSEIYYVQLSNSAINLVQEKSIREKYKIYVNAVEKLLEPILDDLFIILFKEFESVNIFEYTFILSDRKLNIKEKVDLIKDYRKLSKINKIKVVNYVRQEFERINEHAKDKSEKRDFSNWYNESLQIFGLLNQTVYFKTFRRTVLMLSLSQEALEFEASRSQKEKDLYLLYHGIESKDKYYGYEFHHIYPISYATSKKDLSLIDNHKNLLYIKREIHKKITKENTLVKIIWSEKDERLYLADPENNENKIDITDACIFNKKKIHELVEYNKKLLEKEQE